MGTKVLDVLDSEILGCIEKDHPEHELIQLYIDLWRALKPRVGTSSGFTGLSEYIFVRYIIGYIGKRFGLILRPYQCTRDTCIFEADTLLLTHDVFLSQFDSSAPKQKSDVALFTRTNKRAQWRLASVFEIKIGITGPIKLKEMFERLNVLLASSQALVFPIIFNSMNSGPQYKVGLDRFCYEWPGRGFVISKTYRAGAGYASGISLNDAIERSLKSLVS